MRLWVFVQHSDNLVIFQMSALVDGFLGKFCLLKGDVAESLRRVVRIQRYFERDNGAVLDKHLVELRVDHALRDVLDKDLGVGFVRLFLDLFIISQGPALFAVHREIPYLLTDFNALFLSLTFYLNESSIKHLFGISFDDRRLLDNDTSLFLQGMREFLGRK